MMFSPPLSQGFFHKIKAVLTDRLRIISLCEQAILSAANFLVLLILARHMPSYPFGIFSFAYIALQFIFNLHRSVVILPFVVITADKSILATQGRLWRRLNMAVTACALILGLASWVAISLIENWSSWMSQAILATSLFIPPVFLYEFYRRWIIQADQPYRVLVAAVFYAISFVAGAILAGALQILAVAVFALVAANILAAVVCRLGVKRTESLDDHSRSFRSFLKEIGHFAGWSLVSNIAYNGFNHLPPLILGSLSGPLPVAAYQAIRALMQPLNTLTTAIDNFDKPRAARALSVQGFGGLKEQMGRTSRALVILSAPYLILLIVFGTNIVDFVYHGRYSEFSQAVYWWIAATIAAIFAYPFETSLFILRRADVLARGRAIAAVLAIVMSISLIPSFGLSGALAGLCTGTALSGVFGFFYLERVRRWMTKI